MIWLNPLALVALAAVAAPVLIHILVRRHGEPLAFPTLRFLQPTRLAAIRRHLLEDPGLLAVRAAILAAAVAAVSGPLLITTLRRQQWDRRIVRATVIDPVPQPGDVRDSGNADADIYRAAQFTGASLGDSMRRALVWLDAAPPARRELVVVSPFAIGTFDAAMVDAIPPEIGLRLERRGDLPPARTMAAGGIVTGSRVLAREVTFAGRQTAVREVATSQPPAWPIDVVHEPEALPAVDAAKDAVLANRIPVPVPGRRVRLVIGGSVAPGIVAGTVAMSLPWMADAAARLAADRDLRAAAALVATGLLPPEFAISPWQSIVDAADGRPLVVAAASTTELIVVSAAPAAHIATPTLMRALTSAVAPVVDLAPGEVIAIGGSQLQQWSRPPASPPPPNADALRRHGVDDDRQWFWLAAICLLAAETWLRRSRSAAREEHRRPQEETARVA